MILDVAWYYNHRYLIFGLDISYCLMQIYFLSPFWCQQFIWPLRGLSFLLICWRPFKERTTQCRLIPDPMDSKHCSFASPLEVISSAMKLPPYVWPRPTSSLKLQQDSRMQATPSSCLLLETTSERHIHLDKSSLILVPAIGGTKD